jgi:ubiquinone/menaquinone biosynthesis C-methylase UbiE
MREISTDFAPNMVKAARAESQRLGLRNVEHRAVDAERMALEDDSVDGVLCRWGYMLMADPGAALRETRRVLRDGGGLALSDWALPSATRGRASLGESSWSTPARPHRIRPLPESSRWQILCARARC